MTCTRCQGFCVYEWDVSSGMKVAAWRCLNCGNRMKGDDDMGDWKPEPSKKLRTALAAAKLERDGAPHQEPDDLGEILEEVSPTPALAERMNGLTGADLKKVRAIVQAQAPEDTPRTPTGYAMDAIDDKIATYQHAIEVLQSAKAMLVA